MPRPSWALVGYIFTFLSGGLAGAVFTWYMNRPVPTILTYSVTTTTAGTDVIGKGLIPNLKMQIGKEEISVIHTHAIEFIVQSGPQLDKAEIAITFPPGLRIFGKDEHAPSSSLHKISCSQIDDDLRCIMTPLTPGKLNKYLVILATNQREPSGIITATNKLELRSVEEFLNRNTQTTGFFRHVLTVIALLAILAVSVLNLRKTIQRSNGE